MSFNLSMFSSEPSSRLSIKLVNCKNPKTSEAEPEPKSGSKTEKLMLTGKIDLNIEATKLALLGWKNLHMNRNCEAIRHALQGLKLPGISVKIEASLNYILARSYIALKDLKRAKKYLMANKNKSPEDYFTLCTLGVIYAKSFMPGDAMRKFVLAAKSQPNRGEALINIGLIYEIFDQYEMASDFYSEANKDSRCSETAQIRINDLGKSSKSSLKFVFPIFDLSENFCNNSSIQNLPEMPIIKRERENNRVSQILSREYPETFDFGSLFFTSTLQTSGKGGDESTDDEDEFNTLEDVRNFLIPLVNFNKKNKRK